jgi:hypothetical protein
MRAGQMTKKAVAALLFGWTILYGILWELLKDYLAGKTNVWLASKMSGASLDLLIRLATFMVPAALAGLAVFLIFWASHQFATRSPASTKTLSLPSQPNLTDQNFEKAPLTPEQREFRRALKQFALNYPAQLQNLMGEVFRRLLEKEKQISAGSPTSLALHYYIHLSTDQNLRGLKGLLELAKVPIENIDIIEVQNDIFIFLSEYLQRQTGIATLNEITKIDLLGFEEMQAWLVLDAQARHEILKMKAWPEEAEKISENYDDKWASTGKAWKRPKIIY